jgi:hypothetical protein
MQGGLSVELNFSVKFKINIYTQRNFSLSVNILEYKSFN